MGEIREIADRIAERDRVRRVRERKVAHALRSLEDAEAELQEAVRLRRWMVVLTSMCWLLAVVSIPICWINSNFGIGIGVFGTLAIALVFVSFAVHIDGVLSKRSAVRESRHAWDDAVVELGEGVG